VFDQLITIPQIYTTSELCLQVIMAIIVTVKVVWGALYIVQVKSDFWRNVTVRFRLLLHDN